MTKGEFDGKDVVWVDGKDTNTKKENELVYEDKEFEKELDEETIAEMEDNAKEYMDKNTKELQAYEISKKVAETKKLASAYEELKDGLKKEASREVSEEDLTNPNHYKVNGIESIDLMEIRYGTRAVLAFCLLNYDKYTYRAGEKGSYMLDQDKAKWYLDRYETLYQKIEHGYEKEGLSSLLH